MPYSFGEYLPFCGKENRQSVSGTIIEDLVQQSIIKTANEITV